MPLPDSESTPPASERRRQVASIHAKGVIRWRRRAKAAGIIDARASSPVGENGISGYIGRR
jgi:hypothetical protein